MIEKVQYYLINETCVDEETAMKHRQILHENVTKACGNKLFTLTFKQVLQSFCNSDASGRLSGPTNWNGRRYSEPIVMKGIDNNPLIQHDLKMHTWTGEYGHPIIEKGMNELTRQMTIFPPNACWTIDKYWVENKLLMGECTTLAGGYGDMVRDRILTNYPAMASSRAIGGCDKNGNVLPGYMPITFDCVIRPSHKEAYEVKDSEKVNTFPIVTGQQNTMTESAIAFDVVNGSEFKNFLLSESASKQQINMLCDTLRLDYDSMTINENSVTFTSMDENTLERHKVVIPLRQLVNAEYYNLFK